MREHRILPPGDLSGLPVSATQLHADTPLPEADAGDESLGMPGAAAGSVTLPPGVTARHTAVFVISPGRPGSAEAGDEPLGMPGSKLALLQCQDRRRLAAEAEAVAAGPEPQSLVVVESPVRSPAKKEKKGKTTRKYKPARRGVISWEGGGNLPPRLLGDQARNVGAQQMRDQFHFHSPWQLVPNSRRESQRMEEEIAARNAEMVMGEVRSGPCPRSARDAFGCSSSMTRPSLPRRWSPGGQHSRRLHARRLLLGLGVTLHPSALLAVTASLS